LTVAGDGTVKKKARQGKRCRAVGVSMAFLAEMWEVPAHINKTRRAVEEFSLEGHPGQCVLPAGAVDSTRY